MKLKACALKRLIHGLSHLVLTAMCAVCLTFVVLPVPAHAQVAGFAECQFNNSSPVDSPERNQVDQVQRCLRDIFQFTFVIGIFIIAIRVAIVVLGQYNPLDQGQAGTQAVQLVREVVIGLLLIASPVLIISVINPTALNLAFFDIGGLNQNSSSSETDINKLIPNSQAGVNLNTQPTDRNGNTAQDLEQHINRVNETLDPSSSQQQNRTGLLHRDTNFAFRILNPVMVVAQQEATDEEAIRIVSELLALENKCKEPFLTQEIASDCTVIETEGFVQQRRRIKPRVRQLLTPLNDSISTYSGTLFARGDLEVEDVNIPPSDSFANECSLYYAVVTDTAQRRRMTLATRLCRNNSFLPPLWKRDGNTVLPAVGTISAGTQITSGQQFLTVIK